MPRVETEPTVASYELGVGAGGKIKDATQVVSEPGKGASEWAVAEQDTNIVTNQIFLNYNQDVVASQDDGNFPGGAFGYELPVKYTLDSFTQFN